jgi:phosphoribosylamine--glycine ligase
MLIGERFGAASRSVVIEEFLKGIEVSVFVLTDGKNYKILPEAKDYKPIGENNTGPNTGGMGSVSPVNFANAAFMKKVEDTIIRPTIRGLRSGHIDYKGFIFFGLMNTGDTPYVIEYNVRMGDPETQVVVPRIKTDLVDLLTATADGTLNDIDLELDPRSAVTVVMASGGYPWAYDKGHVISSSDTPSDHSIVFHAGTRLENGRLTTQGGRVLAVTGLGENLRQAIEHAYARVNLISWKDVYFRKDIGQDLLALE